MKICIVCGAMIAESSEQCSFCGASIIDETARQVKEDSSASNTSSIALSLDDESLLEFATCKYTGQGTKKNLEEAERLFKELALRNNYEGMYMLARILLDKGDRNASAAWLKIAARAGHKKSELLIKTEFSDSLGADKLVSSASERSSAEKKDLVAIIEGAKKSVVLVESYVFGIDERGKKVASGSCGSGFLVDGGFVITNAHVVGKDPSLILTKFMKEVDDEAHEMEPVIIDADHDLAVLSFKGEDKAKMTERSSLELRLKDCALGESVYTIGNPVGLGFSVSGGVVSYPHREANYRCVNDVIQTDITANHGNSGGALLDYDNKVLGVLTYIPANTEGGVSMCIPARHVKDLLNKIKY